MRKRLSVMAAPLVTAVVVAMSLTAMSLAAPAAQADAPPFGQLPVMGYNTWYQFGAGVTESAVLKQADYLVSSGLAAAGYDTVNLDDGWLASSRASDGSLTWDATKFPHGIPWLASQIHALGLKFGIYEAIGTRTCQGLPGSGGTTASDSHYAQDAATFAAWGVDFVKIDECGGLPSGTTLSSLTAAFEQYGADLRADNPDVVYSEELPIYELGQSGFTQAVQSSSAFASMWRVAADESPANPASDTILGHLAADLHLHGFAGAGHWNDLDMLVPGAPAAHPFGWSVADEREPAVRLGGRGQPAAHLHGPDHADPGRAGRAGEPGHHRDRPERVPGRHRRDQRQREHRGGGQERRRRQGGPVREPRHRHGYRHLHAVSARDQHA